MRFYRRRRVLLPTEALMKPDPQRRQADLFDGEPQPLAILPTQQEELINLLSQLC
jgi:hypothetical protein